jgi:hypothetical protein
MLTQVNIRAPAGASQFPFGGDVSHHFFRCEAARVLLGGRTIALGVGPLSRFPVPLRREALPRLSAVWAYTVCGVFERRGVKAGPQATAQAARSGLYAS